MRSYFVLSFLPLALACNKVKGPPVASADTPTAAVTQSDQSQESPWRQIIGVVHKQEKCPTSPTPTDCFKIVGGEDLNSAEVFYLPDQSLELRESQHVQLVAQLDKPASDGGQLITGVKSVGVIYK